MTPSTPEQKRRSIFLILIFTFIAASAQVLLKQATNSLGEHPTPVALLMNVQLIAGLALYGVGAILMILALQHGELSVLYPLISLSYVWIAILSVMFFHEAMNPVKLAGIIVIMAGVGVMGRGGHK